MVLTNRWGMEGTSWDIWSALAHAEHFPSAERPQPHWDWEWAGAGMHSGFGGGWQRDAKGTGTGKGPGRCPCYPLMCCDVIPVLCVIYCVRVVYRMFWSVFKTF